MRWKLLEDRMRVGVKLVNRLPGTRLARIIQGLEGDPSWTRP